MKKSTILSGLSFLSLLLVASLASASTFYDTWNPSNTYYPNTYNVYPTFSSNSNSNYNAYTLNPVYTINDLSASRNLNSNFDSANFASNYQGASAKMNVQYNEFLLVKPNGKIIKTTSYADNSVYLGATQNVNANTQNRQVSDSASVNTNAQDYNGGFSSNAASAASNTNYGWFTPSFSNGFYNWRY